MKRTDLALDLQLLRINPITGWRKEKCVYSSRERKQMVDYIKYLVDEEGYKATDGYNESFGL